jgi:hypothetical protein
MTHALICAWFQPDQYARKSPIAQLPKESDTKSAPSAHHQRSGQER